MSLNVQELQESTASMTGPGVPGDQLLDPYSLPEHGQALAGKKSVAGLACYFFHTKYITLQIRSYIAPAKPPMIRAFFDKGIRVVLSCALTCPG